MAHAKVDEVEQELSDGRTVSISPSEHGIEVRMCDADGEQIGFKHLAPNELERVVSDEEVQSHILLGEV